MSRQTRKVVVKESTGRRIIEQSRVRLWCVALFFVLCFTSIAIRMVEVGVFSKHASNTITVSDLEEGSSQQVELGESNEKVFQRGDIVDRNGELIATSLMTASAFVNPKEIKDRQEAATKIARLLGSDPKQLLASFNSGKSFIWIKRNLSPKEQEAVNRLGIPGLYFLPEERRVYPYGNLFSHVAGYVGLDNKGLAGIEKRYDQRLRDPALNGEPLSLSVDVRLQSLMHEEMEKAVETFSAIGATGIIMDIRSGELLSMVSLPDFDPHKPSKGSDAAKFNRATLGAYEMGSTFKSFTMAMAMEYGTANWKSSFDATGPIKIGNFTINDSHPMHRWLSMQETYAFSSNIGTARMIMQVGGKRQKAFLEKIGMMQPIDIEVPERSSPLYPRDWKEISSVTIAYGHGISVSPLHLVRGIATLTNGGTLPRLTLLKDGNKGKPQGERIVSEKTSENMRRLMRMVALHGTGTRADIPGYRVGGKTGTAEKVTSGGGYAADAKLASFVGVFPVDNPQYVVLVMIDEPKGNKSTFNFATGGWIAAPVAGKVIARMGPMLGIKPEYEVAGDDAEKFWVDNSPNAKSNEKPRARPVAAPSLYKRLLHAASY